MTGRCVVLLAVWGVHGLWGREAEVGGWWRGWREHESRFLGMVLVVFSVDGAGILGGAGDCRWGRRGMEGSWVMRLFGFGFWV